MANENAKAEKNKIKEERAKLKNDEKQQKKDIKKRAKEIAKRESELDDEDDAGSKVSSALVTIIIVAVWIAILCLLIKMDVGGFGSEILTPLLKNVPVVNKILPNPPSDDLTEEEYGGYTSLKDAVEQIKRLELELEHAQTVNVADSEELTRLQAEIDRLAEFEKMQVEFQRIKEQFYEEIIYSDNGPGPNGYKEYYESIDPTTAAALYKQVVATVEEENEIVEYAATYSAMKPKEAAKIFEAMSDDYKLVARILGCMGADSRGSILGAMDPTAAAKITKIMNPEG